MSNKRNDFLKPLITEIMAVVPGDYEMPILDVSAIYDVDDIEFPEMHEDLLTSTKELVYVIWWGLSFWREVRILENYLTLKLLPKGSEYPNDWVVEADGILKATIDPKEFSTLYNNLYWVKGDVTYRVKLPEPLIEVLDTAQLILEERMEDIKGYVIKGYTPNLIPRESTIAWTSTTNKGIKNK